MKFRFFRGTSKQLNWYGQSVRFIYTDKAYTDNVEPEYYGNTSMVTRFSVGDYYLTDSLAEEEGYIKVMWRDHPKKHIR